MKKPSKHYTQSLLLPRFPSLVWHLLLQVLCYYYHDHHHHLHHHHYYHLTDVSHQIILAKISCVTVSRSFMLPYLLYHILHPHLLHFLLCHLIVFFTELNFHYRYGVVFLVILIHPLHQVQADCLDMVDFSNFDAAFDKYYYFGFGIIIIFANYFIFLIIFKTINCPHLIRCLLPYCSHTFLLVFVVLIIQVYNTWSSWQYKDTAEKHSV